MTTGIKLTTSHNKDGKIIQEVSEIENDARRVVETRILDTSDEHIRKALMALGWTPPPTININNSSDSITEYDVIREIQRILSWMERDYRRQSSLLSDGKTNLKAIKDSLPSLLCKDKHMLIASYERLVHIQFPD